VEAERHTGEQRRVKSVDRMCWRGGQLVGDWVIAVVRELTTEIPARQLREKEQQRGAEAVRIISTAKACWRVGRPAFGEGVKEVLTTGEVKIGWCERVGGAYLGED
jgi:hypothetical protein